MDKTHVKTFIAFWQLISNGKALSLKRNKSLFKENIGVLEKILNFRNNSFGGNFHFYIFLLQGHCRKLGMILFEWKVA